jgi:histidyl-tRNA synthetase
MTVAMQQQKYSCTGTGPEEVVAAGSRKKQTAGIGSLLSVHGGGLVADPAAAPPVQRRKWRRNKHKCYRHEAFATMAAIDFTEGELAEFLTMPPPIKGKPTAEQKEGLLKRKAFLAAVAKRVGQSSKAVEKALSAASEAVESGPPAELCPCSGTRDVFPEDMRERNWLFGHFRACGIQFGFQEYDAPVLESVALYERKAGEEITEQMYNFIDKEGHGVTLRPEMTPSLARMVLLRTNLADGTVKDLLPIKWFSIPQCWRFETTQRGRKREHYQWNMDIVGVNEITAEVELLAAMTTFFRNVGIGPDIVGVKINSRKVLESLLFQLGIKKTPGKDMFAQTCVVIDKLDKIGPDGVKIELKKIGVDEATADTILQAMASKSIEDLAALCKGIDTDCVDEMRRVFDLARDYGFYDYLIFDASVVRGLAYYTGIVFECFDRRGVLRAICGGGRYDRLMSLYGSPKDENDEYKWTVPCVGFGFGDCVIMELLRDLGKVAAPGREVDYVVAAFKPDMFGAATQVAAKLRETGASVDLLPTHKKARWAFDYADRVGAGRVAYVAPDEWARGCVAIKDLRVSEKQEQEGAIKQVDVPFEKIAEIESFFGEQVDDSMLAPALQAELQRAKDRIAALTKRVEALEC